MGFNSIERTLLGSLTTRAIGGDELSEKARKYLQERGETMGHYFHSPAIARTRIFDNFVMDFLLEKPDATIANLGCGLCARFYRLDNEKVKWWEVDTRAVIEHRKQIFEHDEERHKTLVWDLNRGFPNIPQPDLVVSEGCLVYLPKEKVMEILKGQHAVFDVFTLKRTEGLGGDQKWRYDPKEWKLDVRDQWFFDNETPNREACVLHAYG